MNKTSRRSGFTLIELLVVISIIALLAGLAFPALQGAMEAAQKAQASTMCNQMSIACTLYNTEYGVWPLVNSQATVTGSGIGTLCYMLNGNRDIKGGSSTPSSNSACPNTRSIQFMSFNAKDVPASSGSVIQSPYKKGDRNYRVAFDSDYDGQVTGVPDLSSTSTSATTSINSGVAVWTWGDKTGTGQKMLTSYK